MDLFRKEAIERRANRLYGEVALTTPLSTWVLTALIGGLVVGLSVILAFGDYARKETVSGWLKPDKGLIRIVSPQLASVNAVHIVEGEDVQLGDVLLDLNFDNSLITGGQAVDRALSEINSQITESESRLHILNQQHAQNVKTIEDQSIVARKELIRLNAQRAVLLKRVDAAKAVLDRYDALVREDAASFLEAERQRDAVLALEQSLAQMDQRIETKTGGLTSYSNQLAELPLEKEAALAELRESIAALRAQSAQLARQGALAMTAPVSGRVAALPVSVGETLRPQELAIALLPEGGRLEAELFVPTRAAGFIKSGQPVRLQLDAFPFQKFGVTKGRVAKISKTVFTPAELPEALGLKEPAYRITVEIERQDINAYGENFPLQAGMTLNADIIQEKQKLWRAFMEPLLVQFG